MEVLERLQKYIQEMNNNMDAFPLGAAAALEEATLEHKIQKLKDTLKLIDSRLLLFKAKDYARKIRNTHDPTVIERGLVLSLSEFEEQFTKIILQELAWKTTIETSVIQEFLTEYNISEDIPTIITKYGDSYRTVQQLLLQQCEKYAALKVVTKKLSDTMCQVSEKKLSLLYELEQFKTMIITQKKELEEKEKARDKERYRKKQALKLRLDKINTMRMLTASLLACGELDFTPPSRWTDLTMKMRKPITLHNLSSFK